MVRVGRWVTFIRLFTPLCRKLGDFFCSSMAVRENVKRELFFFQVAPREPMGWILPLHLPWFRLF